MAGHHTDKASASLTGVPQYVLDHAPLLHLFTKDPYRPSSLTTHLLHTHPEVNFKPVTISSPPLTLDNLEQLNAVGAKVYLTSNDDITKNPKWLEGIQTDDRGGTGEEKTGVITVVDKGNGAVDVFYFYFFSFNWGGVVLEKQLGDHVGDWEHNMIRFSNGVPQSVWLSQHANGEAYTFSCLQKDVSGKRPILYLAHGSHAVYATTGQHDHTIPNLNLPTPFLLVDETDAGPLYDPILSSYFYTYSTAGVFAPLASSTPTAYLRFTGLWGDAEYPGSDPRQKGKGLLGFKKYVGGPTGPADKQLRRKEVWPENKWSKGQRVRTSVDGKSWWKSAWKKVSRFGKGEAKAKGVKRVKVSGEIIE